MSVELLFKYSVSSDLEMIEFAFEPAIAPKQTIGFIKPSVDNPNFSRTSMPSIPVEMNDQNAQ